MKPRFALNFSHVGLSLLHRVNGGWQVVGDVALDSPDMAQSLRYLRKTAAALAGGQLASKLVIPNSQILYRDLKIPEGDKNERNLAVRRALEGTTPYSVDDLAFDWVATGTRQVKVAAVARETLDEAEAFATEHRFNPVSFVAIPAGDDYIGEPFFGPSGLSETLLENGEKIERDAQVIAVIERTQKDTPFTAEPDDTEKAKPEKTPPEQGDETQTKSEPEVLPAAAAFSTRRSDEPDQILAPRSDRTKARFALYASPEKTAPKKRARVGGAPKAGQKSKTTVTAPSLAGDVRTPKSKPRKRLHLKTASSPQKSEAAPPPPRPAPLPPAPPKPTPTRPTAISEEQALTVFGARKNVPVGGKPKYLGLVLTIGLIVTLLLAALLSSLVFDEPISASRLWRGFGNDSAVATPDAATFDPAIATPNTGQTTQESVSIATPETIDTAPEPTFEITRLTPPEQDPIGDLFAPTESELAEVDLVQPDAPNDGFAPITAQTIDTFYDETGIWPLAPAPPVDMDIDRIEKVYVASIDRKVLSHDALALAFNPNLANDNAPAGLLPPPPIGSTFDLDERGLVRASKSGTLTPDGILIFAGKPSTQPVLRPAGSAPAMPAYGPLVAAIHPIARPAGLVEVNERSQFGGRTRQELATFRPIARPKSQQDELLNTDYTPTALAVTRSTTPKARPTNFATAVEKAIVTAALESADQTTTSNVSNGIAEANVPQIPVRASVAREATLENAISLSKLNLIGIYGSASDRRALVRLKSGRYVKVQIGDRLDGGKVALIDTNRLQYIKGRRTLTLEMPKG